VGLTPQGGGGKKKVRFPIVWTKVDQRGGRLVGGGKSGTGGRALSGGCKKTIATSDMGGCDGSLDEFEGENQ